MGGKAGTLRGISIAGVSYDVIADTNATRIGSVYENTTVSTTGKPILQQTKRNEDMEGIKLGCDPQEHAELKKIADDGSEVEINLTYADGKTYGSTGWINIDNHESETNTTNIKLMPTESWSVF